MFAQPAGNQITVEAFQPVHLAQCSFLLKWSIVKDSSADLGANFKIVQNRPTIKAVCTKISFFFIFDNILIFLIENNEISFFLF